MENKEYSILGHGIQLNSLTLSNFRGFSNLDELKFHKRVTVLIADNGSGKTTILDAIALSLKIYLFQMAKSKFTPPPQWNRLDLKNATELGYINLNASIDFEIYDRVIDEDEYSNQKTFEGIDVINSVKNFRINNNNNNGLVSTIDGYISDEDSEFDFGVKSSIQFRKNYKQLPVIAYYSGNAKDGEENAIYNLQDGGLYYLYANCLEATRLSFLSFMQWYDTNYKIAYMPQTNDKNTVKILNRINDVVERVLNNDDENFTYQNIRMKYTLSGSDIIIDKKNSESGFDEVYVNQLSAGEKAMLTFAVDIAKRLILANPGLTDDPLKGRGVVLIDEIDLHLHPKWQRVILPKLTSIFPNIQFIATTHSPFVVQSLLAENRVEIRNGNPKYFSGTAREDYETVVIDHFNINDFFDQETSNELKRFRKMVEEILKNDRNIKDNEFKSQIIKLSEKGESVKSVIAFELEQLKSKIRESNG